MSSTEKCTNTLKPYAPLLVYICLMVGLCVYFQLKLPKVSNSLMGLCTLSCIACAAIFVLLKTQIFTRLSSKNHASNTLVEKMRALYEDANKTEIVFLIALVLAAVLCLAATQPFNGDDGAISYRYLAYAFLRAVAFCGLSFAAVRITPIGKPAFMTLALLPSMLSASISSTTKCLICGICLLLVAVCLRARASGQQSKLRDYGLAGLAIIVASFAVYKMYMPPLDSIPMQGGSVLEGAIVYIVGNASTVFANILGWTTMPFENLFNMLYLLFLYFAFVISKNSNIQRSLINACRSTKLHRSSKAYNTVKSSSSDKSQIYPTLETLLYSTFCLTVFYFFDLFGAHMLAG